MEKPVNPRRQRAGLEGSTGSSWIKWRRQPPSTSEIIHYLMDQHGLTRGPRANSGVRRARVSEILRGKKGLSMTMVQRLRACFRVPAELLLPPPKMTGRRSAKRTAA
jgi:hypothetical protein